MRGLIFGFLALVVGLDPVYGSEMEVPFPGVPRITKEELRVKLDHPDVIVLDVRVEEQWKVSDRKLPGALHENPDSVASWVKKYPKDKILIIYCA